MRGTPVTDTSESPHAVLKPVPIEAVRMTDSFWKPRLEQMREVTLPSQYDLLEETGRIFNFRRAAGKEEGDFRGIFFNDSDVYKWIEGCAYSLAYERDERVGTMADTIIAEIAAAQRDDGYLMTYYTFGRKDERWTNLKDMHEIYCAGISFTEPSLTIAPPENPRFSMSPADSPTTSTTRFRRRTDPARAGIRRRKWRW